MELAPQYVAGLFDGEGCISSRMYFLKSKYVNHPRIRLDATISNTNREILELIRDKYGGAVSTKGLGKNANCYHWRINGKDNMKRFLEDIYPYVFIKKEQIALAFEFIESLREENLGCIALSEEIHSMRERVHKALRKRKTEDVFRFVN
jgi:hypothetical protein